MCLTKAWVWTGGKASRAELYALSPPPFQCPAASLHKVRLRWLSWNSPRVMPSGPKELFTSATDLSGLRLVYLPPLLCYPIDIWSCRIPSKSASRSCEMK